jgi:hypothetical protein
MPQLKTRKFFFYYYFLSLLIVELLRVIIWDVPHGLLQYTASVSNKAIKHLIKNQLIPVRYNQCLTKAIVNLATKLYKHCNKLLGLRAKLIVGIQFYYEFRREHNNVRNG